MKRKRRILSISLSIILPSVLLLVVCQGVANTGQRTRLWPEIEPFKTSYLKVSKIHEIYYELSGNPEGKPVFFLLKVPYSRPWANLNKSAELIFVL